MKKDIKKVLDEMQSFLDGRGCFKNDIDRAYENGILFCLTTIARKVGIDYTNYGVKYGLDYKNEDDE